MAGAVRVAQQYNVWGFTVIGEDGVASDFTKANDRAAALEAATEFIKETDGSFYIQVETDPMDEAVTVDTDQGTTSHSDTPTPNQVNTPVQ